MRFRFRFRPRRLGLASSRVDERRSRLHQHCSGANHGQVGLRLFTSMLDRKQQPLVGLRKHRQFGCVELTVLALLCPIKCYPPRVGYYHFQPRCFQVPTDPRGSVPASNAIVVSTNDLNPVLRSSRVVASFPSISVAPVQLTMHYALHRQQRHC